MDISLRLEVKQKDAENIIIWLEDQDVTKYLNEDIRSASSLKTILKEGRADLLTCYLNQDGRFFLIDSEKEDCLGFINLFTIRKKKEYEVVIAIGNKENWGKQIAYHALKETMKEVFFRWRIEKLISKIHIENQRSIRLFRHLNFQETGTKNCHIQFEMTFDNYLKTLSSKK